MSSLDAALIDTLQAGIPICPAPFAALADRLDTSEEAIVARIGALLEDGRLTRFGPMVNADRMGGLFTLAALRVPPSDFDRIAALVNAHPEVAHNYERDHAWNMWFVVATEEPARVAAVIGEIERETGLAALNLPKITEYRVALRLRAAHDHPGAASLAEGTLLPASSSSGTTPRALSPLERRVIAATQAGLPLTPKPFDVLANALGVTREDMLHTVANMLARGVIRRIAAVPNHYALGYAANGMSVWDVDDARIDELGGAIGRLPFVSHCYRRPRRLPAWRYNLFAMVHGHTKADVAPMLERISQALRDACRAHEVLYSTRILKKTGMRMHESVKSEVKRCSE